MQKKEAKLKIQKNFTDKERKFCLNIFDLQENETLMFIWWINPVKKLGFIFTDKRVFWNIPVKVTGENDIELHHLNSGKILFSAKSFIDVRFIESDFIIRTRDKKYSFNLNAVYSSENKNLINNIFKDYFEEMKTPSEEYCLFSNSFILKLGYILQKFSIPDTEDVQENAEVEKKDSKFKNVASRTALATASFLRHFIDFILDIFSFLMLSLCFVINSAFNIAGYKLQGVYEEIKALASIKYNFLFFMLVISSIYFILKFLIILTTRKVKKLPPVLLITVQILIWIIASSKFAFLMAINFLLIFIFEQTCGFSKKSIRVKFLLYFIILISIYLIYTYVI